MKELDKETISDYLSSSASKLLNECYLLSGHKPNLSYKDFIKLILGHFTGDIKDLLTRIASDLGTKKINLDDLLIGAFCESLLNQSLNVTPIDLVLAFLANLDDKTHYYTIKTSTAHLESEIFKVNDKHSELKSIKYHSKPSLYLDRSKEVLNIKLHVTVEPEKPVVVISPHKFIEESILYDLSTCNNLDILDLSYDIYNSIQHSNDKKKIIAVIRNVDALTINQIKTNTKALGVPLVFITNYDDFTNAGLRDITTLNFVEIPDASIAEMTKVLQKAAKFKGMVLAYNTAQFIAKSYRDTPLFSYSNSPETIIGYLVAYLKLKTDFGIVPTIKIADAKMFFAHWATESDRTKQNDYINMADQLKNKLKKKIIGQEHAITAIVDILKISHVKINKKGPLATFLFVGPTGVGKTETAKILADLLFNNQIHSKPFLRIDMTEYSEKHSVSKLFGAPPGYVGFEDGGIISNFLMFNPECVILFDEIDKAHPEVLNSLIKVIEESDMYLDNGQKISSENAIFIMTSNHGSDIINKSKIGYKPLNLAENVASEYDYDITKALKAYLRPELLNRFDSIVIFNQLRQTHYKSLTKIYFKELCKKLSDKGISLTYDKKIIEWIINRANTSEYGVRDLQRAFNKYIVTELVGNLRRQGHIRVESDPTNTSKISILYIPQKADPL